MLGFWIPTIIAWLLAAAFLAGGIVNLLGGKSVREDFRRWGYPDGFHLVPGLLQLIAAVLILFPSSRLYGLALAAFVCAAAAVTLIRTREYSHLPPSFMLLAIIGALVTFG